MKKAIIGVGVFIIFVMSGLFVYQNHNIEIPYHCNGSMNIEMLLNNNEKFSSQLDLDFFTSKRGSSELLAVGNLQKGNENYVVARKVVYSIRPSDHEGVSLVTVTREERHRKDTLPDALWKYIQPETVGTEFYTEIKNLNNKAIMTKRMSNPDVICAIIEK